MRVIDSSMFEGQSEYVPFYYSLAGRFNTLTRVSLCKWFAGPAVKRRYTDLAASWSSRLFLVQNFTNPCKTFELVIVFV